MSTWLITFLFGVGAVALFMVGLSITLMVKGHHIESEIETNREMRKRGIRCAREQEIIDARKCKDCSGE
ncbi:MAG: hypothetical protein IKT28_05250 [Rikenellaceae bacterium]|jgi:hypothetical protein|nr:hypothetical protein [Rikenellaceae bacterium]MBO5873937.1 hypothetical protein [Rikenellaceae bacterium]MBR4999526.1 hypothetical protein [Rikenellaceae bacterium]MBR6496495.1 hypothetical protein [Rikenellaceae bacterium]